MKKGMLILFFLSAVSLFGNGLKILYPNGGETLFKNRNVETIRWQAPPDIGEVVILLYQRGVKILEIRKNVKPVPNLPVQTFIWNYSPQIKEGDGYRIRIRALKDLSINDFSDRDFEIKRK